MDDCILLLEEWNDDEMKSVIIYNCFIFTIGRIPFTLQLTSFPLLLLLLLLLLSSLGINRIVACFLVLTPFFS